MAFAPSASWNSRSITHLANYPSPSLPMIFSDESLFERLLVHGYSLSSSIAVRAMRSGGQEREQFRSAGTDRWRASQGSRLPAEKWAYQRRERQAPPATDRNLPQSTFLAKARQRASCRERV